MVNGPWWAEGKQLVWTLGPVTIGFFLFTAVLFGWLPSPMLRAIESNHELIAEGYKHRQTIETMLAAHFRALEQERRQLSKTLLSICRHTAKSEMQRYDCDQ